MRYRFRYTGIRVRDLERSLAFYTGALGMKEIARGEMPHGGLYVHLRTPRGPQRLELNWYPKGSRFFSPYREGQEMDHLAFVVDNVGKAYKELVAKGAEPAVTPAEAKGVTEVYVKDPDGIWIELLS
ncbi:MAG TPA: VOC family protein [Thermoplasmata archaeon]|jgi:lactoylglutathione lyase